MTDEEKTSNYLWANELLRALVFEYRLISFEYFMEDLSIFHAWKMMENIQYTDFTFKTMIRYQIWSLYNSNGFAKNKNKIEDIMELPWDKNDKESKAVSDKQLREAQELAKSIEEMMMKGNVKTEKYTLNS